MSHNIMNTKTRLFNILRATKYPVMLMGQHGVGKSEMIKQFAEEEGKPCLDIRLSQYTEGDLLGIPRFDEDTKTTMFFPPKMFYQASVEPCIVFLDELNRATREVRQAVFQLADSYRLGALKMHPETQIISACNPDDQDYQVNPLDPAELDRWMLFHFAPSEMEWLDWAEEVGVDPQIVKFIEANKNLLDPPQTTGLDPMKKYPSRRSWKRLSDSIARASMGRGIDTDLLSDLSVACLGSSTGSRFASQYSSVESLINPFIDKIDATSISQEEMMRIVTFLSDRSVYQTYTSKENFQNLLHFLTGNKNRELLKTFSETIRSSSDTHWTKLAVKECPGLMSIIYQ
jgi:hypothetical protein